MRVRKRSKHKIFNNLSSKSSEEESNSDGTGSGGELSSASPGDIGGFTSSVGEVGPDGGLRVDFVVDVSSFLLEVDGVLWAIKSDRNIAPEAIEGICNFRVSDVTGGRGSIGDFIDINVTCDELVVSINPGDLGSDQSVCEDKSVDVGGGGLSEPCSSSLGRGPLDTEGPAGEAIVVSGIAIICGGSAVFKEGGKVTSEETNKGGGGVITRGSNLLPDIKVSG